MFLHAPTETLLEAIKDPKVKQADVAGLYRICFNKPDAVNWEAVNKAIIERWSMSGLTRIKNKAWKDAEKLNHPITKSLEA